jgi:putative SOS response-associated peptidase YedK
LDPALHDRNELEEMLRPPPAGTLEHYRVSRDVGNVNNNDAHLLEVSSA